MSESGDSRERFLWEHELGEREYKEPWHGVDDIAWHPEGERLLVCGVQVDEDVVAGPGNTWFMTRVLSRDGELLGVFNETGGSLSFDGEANGSPWT